MYTSNITKVAEKNDILMSVRAPVGDINIAPEKLCIGRGLCSLKMKESNNIFLYYLLKYYSNVFINNESGTVFGSINKNDINNLNILIPKDIGDQDKIGQILNQIDSKIEVNMKINNNLYELGYLLFKEYLINFKEYDEKDLEYSDFGFIPKSWHVESLLNIANYQNGLAMQKYRPNENEGFIPVLKIKELRQGYCDNNSDICKCNLDADYLVNSGDVIFAWSGSLMLKIWSNEVCGLNQHLFKVTSDKYDKWFYFYWTKYYLNKFIKIAEDKATTMGHIKRTDLKESLVVIPDEITYNKLNNILNPLFSQIIEINNENNKLTKLRDTLLPKLMSGEIDVSNINFD